MRRRITRIRLEIDKKREHLNLLGMAEDLFFLLQVEEILKNFTSSAYYLSITGCNIFSS